MVSASNETKTNNNNSNNSNNNSGKTTNDNEDLEIAKLKLKLEGKSGLTEYQQKLLEWSENVDKRYAWVILLALFIIMSSVLGTYRIYGLVFAKVTAQGIYNRQDASWPVSMIYTTENVCGPLVSIATYYLSVRMTLFIGGVMITLGNLVTYFSQDFYTDVIFLGLVQGLGYSFVLMPFMQIVNSYFLRYRNIALGLALCGGTISIFALSPIAQYILDNYSWRTSYLVIAIICSLNLFMAPLILPNPKPNFQEYLYEATNGNKSGTLNGITGGPMSRNSLSRMSKRALSYRNSISLQTTMLIRRKTSIDPISGLARQESVISMNPFASTVGAERRISHSLTDSKSSTPTQLTNCACDSANIVSNSNNNTLKLKEQQQQPPASPVIGRHLMKQTSIYSTESHLVIDQVDEKSFEDTYNSMLKSTIHHPNCAQQQQNQQQQLETMSIISDAICSGMEPIREQQEQEFDSKLIWDILKKPAFHVIWFNELLYFWVFSIYCLVLADLGHDRGCTEEEAENLLNFQSIGELVGRLVLTILVDLHYLSNKSVTTILLFATGGLLILVTQITGYYWMAGLTVGISSSISLLYIMLNGLLVDYIGESEVTLSYGMASCISGIGMYFRPQAVGYFRDYIGSYDWLLIWLGIACVLAGLMWLVEPLAARLVAPKSNYQENNQYNSYKQSNIEQSV